MEVVVEREDGVVVCERCVLADRLLPRMKGLLGRADLPRGDGILLRPASSIHMWFMRFPIDAVFLDGDLRALRVVRELGPWRIASKRGSKAVLELSAGECARLGLAEGDRLRLREHAA